MAIKSPSSDRASEIPKRSPSARNSASAISRYASASRPPWPIMIRILPSCHRATAPTQGSSESSNGSKADEAASGSRNMRSSGATSPSSGLGRWLRWLNRYAWWIHSATWCSSPRPEPRNCTTSAYTMARTSSLTWPGVLVAATISSRPSTRRPPSHQYQPAAAASRIAGRERTTHRGTDVVVLGLERGKPFQLLGAAKMRLRGLGEFGEVAEMRTAYQVRFPRLREPLRGVLLDRADHPVARSPAHLPIPLHLGEQQGLLGQRGEQLEHLLLLDRIAGADSLSRL